MKIRIALAGELTYDERIFGKIDVLLGQITGYMCKDASYDIIQAVVSPSYTGKDWIKWTDRHGFSLCTYNMQNDNSYDERCTRIVRSATAIRSLIGEAICDRADVLIVSWSEDVPELSGATWELLRIAYERKIPCIWISTKSLKTFCILDTYYEKYNPHYLEAMLEPMQNDCFRPADIDENNTLFFSFWEKLRSKYLKKYKADTTVHPSKEDNLMKQDFSMEKESSEGEPVRQGLIEKFNQFDSAAVKLNSKFQSLMYARSVLPFITTIFLAIGFYAETLVGKTWSWLSPDMAAFAASFALILAGIGFLVHGLLNLYVYRLSKSQRIVHWKEDFLQNRSIAEILRVMIHFLPYGFELNIRKLCFGNKKIFNAINHITDDIEAEKQTIDRKTTGFVLGHINEMLDDQTAYQKSSVNRYKKIVESLEKWGKGFFYAGLIIVLFRAALQFLLALNPIGALNGLDLNGWIRSFANMLALILPAWAGYFSTKIQQNNFKYNLNNHTKMAERLSSIQEKVVLAMEQEEIQVEIVNAMIEELAEVMLLEDTSQWQRQYMNSSVKPL